MPKTPETPTDAHLTILNVLWDRGASTVREVHEALPASLRRGYTTTLKQMQLMVERGLLSRDESGRSHQYRPLVDRGDTLGTLVRDLRDRAFGGSAAKLVLRALSDEPASPDEVAQIRSLLDQLESDGGAS